VSINDVRSQVKGVCPKPTFFEKEDSSDTDVRTFWCKTLRILRIMVRPHGQGRGVNYSRFCADVLYRRPL